MNLYECINKMSVKELAGFLTGIHIRGIERALTVTTDLTKEEMEKTVNGLIETYMKAFEEGLVKEEYTFRVYNKLKKEFVSPEKTFLKGTGDIIIKEDFGSVNISGNPNYIISYLISF